MRRRALLSALAAGLAGCGATDSAPADGSPGDDLAAGTATTATPTFQYTTAGGGTLLVEAGPVDAPALEWTVAKQAPATPDHPARLRVAVENTGEARDLTAAGALPFPVTPGRPVDGDDATVPALAPVDGDRRRRWTGHCWQSPLDDPQVADDAPWDWGYGEERTVTLAAGERLVGTYHVVSSTTAACVGRGEYAFVRRYALDGREHEWSFTLTVPSVDRDP